jgi:hypothetical protein
MGFNRPSFSFLLSLNFSGFSDPPVPNAAAACAAKECPMPPADDMIVFEVLALGRGVGFGVISDDNAV